VRNKPNYSVASGAKETREMRSVEASWKRAAGLRRPTPVLARTCVISLFLISYNAKTSEGNKLLHLVLLHSSFILEGSTRYRPDSECFLSIKKSPMGIFFRSSRFRVSGRRSLRKPFPSSTVSQLGLLNDPYIKFNQLLYQVVRAQYKAL